MRIKPNRLSQISVNFADISPRWNENFAYEHAQASHPGFALRMLYEMNLFTYCLSI